jgi:hypothetical protein
MARELRTYALAALACLAPAGALSPDSWDKVLGISAPDGRAHVCAVPSRNGGGALVLCVVLEGGA